MAKCQQFPAHLPMYEGVDGRTPPATRGYRRADGENLGSRYVDDTGVLDKPDAGRPASAGSGISPELHAILGWLAHAALAPNVDGADLFGLLCERLRQAGVPLWRAALQLENLHPLYYGYCLHWYAGEAAVEVPRTHDFAETDAFARAPISLPCGAPI
jgi:hypothetical protein